MAELLELIDISKTYEDESIVSGVSLTVESGTSVAITGVSGGGKTTLLSIAGLLQKATEGRILVGGREVSGLEAQEQAAVRGKYFGFVFQRARLINSLTVLENVLLPAVFTGQQRTAAKRAKELLLQFDMGHRLEHKPQQLSLGQLRRVSLARALLLEPPFLLADEPTNDLDPALTQVVADELFRAKDAGAGLIIITHDPELAGRADRRFRLDQGKLIG